MSELKNCPFCGNNAQINLSRNGAEFLIHRPECSRCSCTLGASTDEDSAIQSWNRRADDAVRDKLIKFIKNIEQYYDDDMFFALHLDARELLKEIDE